jgi:non-ribosomal peptide synthetase component E (peptide arylation enzyme)
MQKKIAAYIEISDCPIPESILTTQLKKYAERKLPKFMIPHQYVYVEKFPLMLSGKVDRKTLSEIHASPSSEAYSLSDIEKKFYLFGKNY